MEGRHIIMNYTVSPSLEDIEVIAESILETLPDELTRFCENIRASVEELADEGLEEDLDLDDPFDLLALFKSGKEIAPGIESKTTNNEDILVLYRRAILDMWCETGEDLMSIIRQVIIEELARNFNFSDEEIREMTARHYQGLL